MSDFMMRPIVLVALCALAYAFSTLAMKAAAQAPGPTALVAIGITLGVAVIVEVILMRQFPMAVVYIGILATETLLVLIFASFFGEALTLTQVTGAGLVLCGAVLVSV